MVEVSLFATKYKINSRKTIFWKSFESHFQTLICSLEDLRPATATRRPWTSTLRSAGTDDKFRDQVTSKEHYAPPFSNYERAMPIIKHNVFPIPMNTRMVRETTYNRDIDNNAVFQGLRPKPRFDPTVRKPDSFNWMWIAWNIIISSSESTNDKYHNLKLYCTVISFSSAK